MAAIIPMLIPGLAGGASLAGGLAATAGAAGAGAMASGALTALQVGGGVVGAISSFMAGNAKAKESREQADRADMAGRDEYITGKDEAAKLVRELGTTVANQRVAFAAGGVSLASPSVIAARDRALTAGADAAETSSNNAARRRLNLNAQAGRLRSRAGMEILQGLLGGVEALTDTGMSVLQRG